MKAVGMCGEEEGDSRAAGTGNNSECLLLSVLPWLHREAPLVNHPKKGG